MGERSASHNTIKRQSDTSITLSLQKISYYLASFTYIFSILLHIPDFNSGFIHSFVEVPENTLDAPSERCTSQIPVTDVASNDCRIRKVKLLK